MKKPRKFLRGFVIVKRYLLRVILDLILEILFQSRYLYCGNVGECKNLIPVLRYTDALVEDVEGKHPRLLPFERFVLTQILKGNAIVFGKVYGILLFSADWAGVVHKTISLGKEILGLLQ